MLLLLVERGDELYINRNDIVLQQRLIVQSIDQRTNRGSCEKQSGRCKSRWQQHVLSRLLCARLPCVVRKQIVGTRLNLVRNAHRSDLKQIQISKSADSYCEFGSAATMKTMKILAFLTTAQYVIGFTPQRMVWSVRCSLVVCRNEKVRTLRDTSSHSSVF